METSPRRKICGPTAINLLLTDYMNPSELTPFQKFDTLTRKAMSVPKVEVDKRAEKARKEREERKRK